MSDPLVKAERSKAKDIRQGVIEQRPCGTKSKREKPIVIERRFHPNCIFPFSMKSREWRTWGRYRTHAEAVKVISGLERKYSYFEFRIKQ